MGKHSRPGNGSGRYHLRLQKRGLSNAQVRMPFIDRCGRKYSTMDDMKRGDRRPCSERD